MVIRFFSSRGPATLQDFTKWSGLTQNEARTGLENVKSQLVQEELDGKTFWSPQNFPLSIDEPPTARLLPTYDEYFISYKDHRGAIDPSYVERVVSRNGQTIVIDGLAAGTWKRTLKRNAVVVELNPFFKPGEAEASAIDRAVEQFGEFLNLAMVVNWIVPD
jgi:hypothetical protein